MKNFFKALGFTLLMGIIYLAINLIIGLAFMAVLLLTKMDMISDMMTSSEVLMDYIGKYALHMTVLTNVIMLLVVWLIFLARKDSFKSYIGFRRVKRNDLLLMIVFGIALNFIIGPVLSFVMELLPQAMSEQYMELMELIFDNNPSIILLILSTSIMAPLFEEITLRGIVLNDFKKAVPTWVAIIIQAIFFGILHGNIIQGTYAFVIGVVLGVVYIKYNSIWSTITIHLAFNFTSVLLGLFITEEGSLIQIAMLVIGIVVLIPTVYFLNKNYDQASYEVA